MEELKKDLKPIFYWFEEIISETSYFKEERRGEELLNAAISREIPDGLDLDSLDQVEILEAINHEYGVFIETKYFNSPINGVPPIRVYDLIEYIYQNISKNKFPDYKTLELKNREF